MRCSTVLAGSLGLALGACADAAPDRTTRHPVYLRAPTVDATLDLPEPLPAGLMQRLDELDARAVQLDALLAEGTPRSRR
jgi:hypothetical protein